MILPVRASFNRLTLIRNTICNCMVKTVFVKKILLLPMAYCLLCACHNTPAPGTAIIDTPPAKALPDALPVPKKDTLLPPDTARNRKLVLSLDKGTDSVSVSAGIEGPGKSVHITLNITHGRELVASVTPDAPNGNVRISQVIMPDGSADGPFGRSMRYPVKQKGHYELVIGQNLMAAEKEWKGMFLLKVAVRE